MRPALAGAVLLLAAASGCATIYEHPLPPEAIRHRAKTEDGWEIALVQYLPKGVPTGRPILLCHGISANARHMDLDETYSLARWFAVQGREAWTMSIRGTGESDRVAPEQGRQPGFTFDTVWQQDIPTAIQYVRTHAETPKLIARARRDGVPLPARVRALEGEAIPRIDYVGHSMGGMLIYAYLSQGGEGLNAVVTLGSPTRMDWGSGIEPAVVDGSKAVLSGDDMIPMEAAALLMTPLQGRVDDTPLVRLLYNPENTTPEAWRRLVAIGTGDISSGLWFQIAGMTQSGRFESADGKVDYRKDMARIRVPVLVVAGKIDRIATPPAVKDGYRALGGPKQWILAAEENGFQADYGHMDFLIGKRAESELWPALLEFLSR